jgi:hypothetical protein
MATGFEFWRVEGEEAAAFGAHYRAMLKPSLRNRCIRCLGDTSGPERLVCLTISEEETTIPLAVCEKCFALPEEELVDGVWATLERGVELFLASDEATQLKALYHRGEGSV